jgi:hypothetical protein
VYGVEGNMHEEESRKYSITPSGWFGGSPENIVTLEKFISEREVHLLNNFIRNNNVWDQTQTHYNENGTVIYDSDYWKDRVITGENLRKASPPIYGLINKMVLRMKDEVDAFFSVDARPSIPAMVRWLPGNLQMPHADKELHDGPDAGTPNDFPWYDIAGLFYINEDYEGGELYFPNQDIKLKPRAGNAYFFPGDKNYIHGVTEITSGVRYTVPFFWTIYDHTGERKPDDNFRIG